MALPSKSGLPFAPWLITGLPLVVIPLIFSTELLDSTLLPQFLALALLLAAAFLFLLFSPQTLQPSFNLRGIPLLYLAFGVWTAICIPGMRNPGEGLIELQRLGMFFLFFMLLTGFLQRVEKPFHLLARTVTVATILFSLLAFYQFRLASQADLDIFPAMKAVFAQPNLLANFWAMALPFCLFLAWMDRKAWRWTGVAALVVGLIGLGVLLGKGGMQSWDLEGHALSEIQHAEIRGATLELAADHLLSGVGPGGWQTEVKLQGDPLVGFSHVAQPVNDYWALLAERGLPGLLLYLAIFGLAIWSLVRNFRTSRDRESRAFAGILILGIAGYLVTAFFSFTLDRVGIALYVHALLAGSLLLAPRTESVAKPFPRWIYGLGLAFALLVLASGILRTQGEYYTRMGFKAWEEQNFPQVIGEMESALSPFYKLDRTGTPLAWYQGEAHFALGEIPQASLKYRIAFQINPHSSRVLTTWGRAEIIQHEFQAARGHLKEALALAPGYKPALLNLAVLHALQGVSDSTSYYLSLLETDVSDSSYQQALERTTWAVSKNLAARITHEPLQQVVLGMADLPDWRAELVQKSISNHIPLENQCLLDAVYILETVEQKISAQEAESLRKEYLGGVGF
ncbi:MAG: hypothetical protein H6581_24325 [Bacteroidia bacterium]|nr:hypothetical protein [Bacteroidia bacterium]